MSDDVIIEELDSSDIPEGELSEFKIVDSSTIVAGTSGFFPADESLNEDLDLEEDESDDFDDENSGDELASTNKERLWLSSLLKGNIPKVNFRCYLDFIIIHFNF
jgi:hypothetical protein